MRTFLILLIIAAGLAGGWWWMNKKEQVAAPEVMQTEVLALGDVRELLQATGIIKSQVGAAVKIGTRATGRIDRMLVKVGDQVAEDQLIAVIDDRELQAQRKKLLADLNAARASEEYARKNLARQRELRSKKLVDQDTLDEAQERVRLKAGGTAALMAELETLDVRISYTRIYSPMAGVVSQVAAQEGETVVSGQNVSNLVTVLDPSRLELWVYLDETDVGRAEHDMAIEFTVDAFPNDLFVTAIKSIYPEPEIRDNIVYYRALALITPEQAQKLRPEMTAQCKVVVRTQKDVLSLPNTALKWVNGEQVVFVVNLDQSVRLVTEKEGLSLGLAGLDQTEVLGGLEAGQTVATKILLPENWAPGGKPGQDKKPGSGRGPGG